MLNKFYHTAFLEINLLCALTWILNFEKLIWQTVPLNRRANYDGDVGNEVETEQIACDASIGSDKMGKKATLFVYSVVIAI